MKQIKRLLLLVASAFFIHNATAQISFYGRVVDSVSESALPGVHIVVPGTTFGSITDEQGNFSFTLDSPPQEIAFSSVGYQTIIVVPGDPSVELIIRLEPTYVDMSPVVVTASRGHSPRNRVPASITSLSVSQIEHSKPSMLFQALNQVAGVHMVDLGNEQYKMSIRQPFTNKAYFLYMEDGIPLRPTGIFNPNALIDINMAGIDRVEVLRGPVSAQYGSNAVAGALNFITPSIESQPTARLSARINDRGYRRTDFSASTRLGKGGVYLGGYGAQRRDGWFDHSDFDKISFTAKVEYPLSTDSRIETAITVSNLNTDTNGALDSLNYYSRNMSSLHTFTYRDMGATRLRSTYSKTWSERSKSSLTGYYRNAQIEQLPYWRVRTKRSDRSKATGEINKDKFWSLGLLGQHDVYFDQLNSRLTFGGSFDNSPATYWAEYIDVSKDENGRYVSYVMPDSMLTDYGVRIQNAAAFARIELEPIGNLRVVGSLRYDNLLYDYDNDLDPTAYSGAPDEVTTFSRVSPKIGLTYDFGGGRGVYGNYSLGFVPPEVFELYNGVKIPQLESALFSSYEVGGWAALIKGVLFLDVSVYAMEGRDEIIPVILDDGSRENRNAGHTRHRGIEYTLHVRASNVLSMRLAGSNASHEFVEYNENGNDYSGNEMMNAPAAVVNGEVSVKPPMVRGLELSAEWQRIGSYQLDNANTVTYPGHDIFHVRASFTSSKWQTWLSVNNVFDEIYATTAAAYSFGTLYNVGYTRNLTVGVGYRY